ncbi:hypothetical protein ACLOJK_019576, partial [Asimina triloba]
MWDLSGRHRDKEKKETRLLMAEIMSFPHTALDDDAPEKSGSFVSEKSQETKDFYVKKESSCDRSAAGAVPSCVARRRSGMAEKEKIREQPSRDRPPLEG